MKKKYRVVIRGSKGINEHHWDVLYGRFTWIDNLKGARKQFNNDIEFINRSSTIVVGNIRLEESTIYTLIFGAFGKGKIIDQYNKEA